MELSELYINFYKSLLHYIKGKIKSPEDAEDVLQDVFTKIAKRNTQVPLKENVKNWLFIVTRNAIYDYYRKRGVRHVLSIERENDEVESISSEDFDLDTTKVLEQCLEGFINALPERYKQIVQESELKGVSQKELAVQYNMTYSSLRSRVQRGRDQVRKMLMECCQIELNKRGNILNIESKNSCAENSCLPCDN